MSTRCTSVFFVCFLCCIAPCIADRKVTTEFINDCANISKKCGSIGHVRAVGTDDELHYLFSTIGLPTVFVAHTGRDAKVTIDWDVLLSDNKTQMDNQSIKITNVNYTYSLLFNKLIDYNDTKDKADMTYYDRQSTNWNTYNLNMFSWTNLSDVSNLEQNMIMFEAKAGSPSEVWQYNGSFSIKFNVYGMVNRDDQLPHLQYTENIAQFDLTINALWTNFSMSRFGVEVIFVGGDSNGLMAVDQTKLLDDEYAPGVFKLNNWLTKSNNRQDTGYLQWKPVCYQSQTRTRDKGTRVKNYAIVHMEDDDEVFMDTIAYGYYTSLNQIMKYAGNFSFGLGEDGGYNKTQLLTWSASIGYGEPPTDSVSTVVLIIIIVGLGLPVLIIIVGGVFVCVKKRCSNKSDSRSSMYSPINN